MIFRITIVVFFLIQFSFSAISQSQDWKQIASPFETSIYIVHQTSQGYFFGRMNQTNQMYFSNDRGNTWRFISDNIGEHSNNKMMIREDILGNIFHQDDDGIYKINLVTLSSSKVIHLQNILDFTILKNDNFIVATTGRITVHSPQGSILNQYSLTTHFAQFLMDTDGQNHYIVNGLLSTRKIMKFNEDLSFVSENKPTNSGPEIIRNGHRFFREEYFSEDGLTWVRLNFPDKTDISFLQSGHDGALLFISDDKLFTSYDNGNTLIQYDLPLSKTSYVSSDISGEIVITQKDLHSPLFYLSNDQGRNWTLVTHGIGFPYMNVFTAGINENLYARNDLNYKQMFYKRNEWSPWEISNHPDSHRFSDIMCFSDGTITSLSQWGQLYETKNYGSDWQLISNEEFGISYGSPVIEKSEILYQVGKDKMHYSEDFGKNWKTILHSDSSILFLFDPIFVPSIDFGTYYIDNKSPLSNQIIYYNYITKEKITNLDPPKFYDAVTSYNDETLYGLGIHQGDLKLSISKDYGETFTYKNIQGLNTQTGRSIKSDHLNNIYVYTDKQVFYTSDEGENWFNITPDFPGIHSIRDLQVSYDNYIYVSTIGMGILKFKNQLAIPKKLSVRVLDDKNKNCMAEENPDALKSVKVLVNGISLRQPDDQGLSSFIVNSSVNEVKVIYNPELYNECESSYTIEFEDTDTELHFDIPLKVLKYCADPVVGLSVPFLRRCFDNTYSGSVCNEGNIESINTEIEITLDPFFDFISASLPVKSINGQILVLDAGHIQPGDCQSFHFVVNVNCDSELGQEHCISAYTSTDSEDCGEIPTARGAYVDCQENIGAYDPNDKNIFVNGNRNQTYIEPGDKIEYLIRFQNTGTDTAFTVRIEDPITKKFNVSSLKPVAASHDYTWSVDNGMLVVLFEDIQLVDSFKNEPASHGFIKFEIQLDSLTLRGDDGKNLAGIFFDFNEAIITEEVVTVIGQPLNTKEQSFETITAFPNPANGLVYISGEALSDKPQDLMIYDIHGKLILSQKISHYSNSIDISKCAPGTYMLMMKSGEKVFRGKLLKM